MKGHTQREINQKQDLEEEAAEKTVAGDDEEEEEMGEPLARESPDPAVEPDGHLLSDAQAGLGSVHCEVSEACKHTLASVNSNAAMSKCVVNVRDYFQRITAP